MHYNICKFVVQYSEKNEKALVVTDLILFRQFRRKKWIFMEFLTNWSLVDIKALRPVLFEILFLKVQ